MTQLILGDLGHFLIISAFATSIASSISYYRSIVLKNRSVNGSKFITDGRSFFILHLLSVWTSVGVLFYLIFNDHFEYHYVWSHSSIHLPVHFKVSCFWEGQEGSFLLWIFWQTIIGLILIRKSKKWEPSLMVILSLVQAFLISMILGVVIMDFKIGSSPFILLRDAMDAPIFAANPNFIPQDGSGLNPLLQNYWMVIHPPVLFLGFALTIVPFAYALSGLWNKNHDSWVKPTMPWALAGGAILGLGIMMGAYWAYETLNFGGYWNWDPVENAVYVPWIILIAGIHTMMIYRKNSIALKASYILSISTFLLILYSTFLTRSGILGNSSVHSFTDLGLSGQLLIYLLFFTIAAVILMIVRWKTIPTEEAETGVYSRSFWIFLGAITLFLTGFQVIIPTSIPVYNSIMEGLGFVSNIAPPADQVGFYSKFQIWFAIVIAVLSGTAQFFWWKRMKKGKWFQEMSIPLVVTLLLSTLIMALGKIHSVSYILLLTSGLYAIISNVKVLFNLRNQELSGGAITHIGLAVMLIGILFSSGYSKVISMNKSGMMYSADFPDEINRENLLLFLDEQKEMDRFSLTYTGRIADVKDHKKLIYKNDIKPTPDPYKVVLEKDIYMNDELVIANGDTVEVNPENTYFEVQYTNENGKSFSLYPRLQENPNMGNVVSPSIRRTLLKDIYTHVTVVGEDVKSWSEDEFQVVNIGERFFIDEYPTTLNKVSRVMEVDGITLNENDVAVEATVTVHGTNKDYILRPVYVIKDKMAGQIPDENTDLGIRLNIAKINPESDSFEFIINTAQKDYIILKAVVKPLINLVWLGTIIMMVGFTIAYRKRRKK